MNHILPQTKAYAERNDKEKSQQLRELLGFFFTIDLSIMNKGANVIFISIV